MWTYDKHGVIGSLLEPFPFINKLRLYSDKPCCTWIGDSLWIPIIASAIYLLVIRVGIHWMSNRKPYGLKKTLQVWNIGLAVFSILGTLSLLPNQVHGIMKHGIFYNLCLAQNHYNPHIGFWGLLFAVSKYFELLDTLFLVLRKKPVSFLHWYHHTTVLVYSWYSLGKTNISGGLIFSSINYAVHSLMYTYYFLRSASVFIPSGVALFITTLQISQMFVGLAVNVYLYYQVIVLKRTCHITPYIIYIGLIVYGSYAVLFIQFFMGRYVWNTKKKTN